VSAPRPEDIKVALATDCGSTTTKAILIEYVNGEYRQTYRGEAPTTVEAPFDDVTVGARNAITEVEELSGRKLLDENGIITPVRDGEGKKIGADVYVSTSSAGGGLQMAVAGLVRSMTAESAERAALGAGAIVMETLSIDDGRQPFERVALIRNLRPDIFLVSGGTDGGNKVHVVETAETLVAADPRPRFGSTFKLPVVYAGNKEAAGEVGHLLGEKFAFEPVANIRPALERENLGPARAAIHEAFLHHVMSHAPGYDKLMGWTPVPIMSTPHAVGKLTQEVADRRGIDALAVDIGGATTDVFSVFGGTFNRTVSANLGMSYSVCNVLLEAGIESICRWLPLEIEPAEAADRLRNKMIRPTTIPQTAEDLFLEQAVAREALRLALEHHRSLAVGLKGVAQERTIADAFDQIAAGASLVDMMKLDLVIGSGGVLSHAPRREQAALMLLDAFAPEGFTQLAVDSIFMMPHLGVLSTVHAAAATEVFEKDCLVPLGAAIAPAGPVRRAGEEICRLHLELPGGPREEVLRAGELKLIPLETGATAEVTARPARRFDCGDGPGAEIRRGVKGGVVGLVLDGRGRPVWLPPDGNQRRALIRSWLEALKIGIGEQGSGTGSRGSGIGDRGSGGSGSRIPDPGTPGSGA
jgi:uncharacterized protein (TIGR01319 family)